VNERNLSAGDRAQTRRKVWTFLVLTLALSAIFYARIMHTGALSAGGGLGLVALMWSPGVAALVTRLIYQRNLKGEGWGWGETRWQLFAYLLPISYATVAYGVVWLAGLGRIGDVPAGLASRLTLGMLSSVFLALGEELGWRGLLVPELAKLAGFTRTALVTGVIWASWHLPLVLFADYNSGTPQMYAVSCFVIMVVGLSFAIAWLRLRSGSVWTATIMHASHNLWIQGVFDEVTIDTGRTRWFTTEFGVALAVVGLVLAVVFWKLGGPLQSEMSLRHAAPSA
jgi:membrane protease YdiL (CAAX protease family)